MKLQIYKSYILKSYLSYFFVVTFVFFILTFLLNILEEIVFFEKYEAGIQFPLLFRCKGQRLLSLPYCFFTFRVLTTYNQRCSYCVHIYSLPDMV